MKKILTFKIAHVSFDKCLLLKSVGAGRKAGQKGAEVKRLAPKFIQGVLYFNAQCIAYSWCLGA